MQGCFVAAPPIRAWEEPLDIQVLRSEILLRPQFMQGHTSFRTGHLTLFFGRDETGL
jgi:hypothetical protein